jgi:tRNA A-37 threonylcarbamoyl transferase component Bud32
LFAAALEQPPERLASFLAGATDDVHVRNEVLSLLEAHRRRGRLDSILDRLHALEPAAFTYSASEVWDRLRDPLEERYRAERELGRGGMAIVFLAEDVKHRRRVALKVLKPQYAHDIGTARFLTEIAIVSSLAHPHILPLHDSGEAGGLLYYVMPYVEGESLRDRLTREARLPVDEALRITREVADALAYAHQRDVIHRDIKPENILLEAGHAVVTDFGIARAMRAAGDADLAEAAIALGTPAYMSPEQARGDPHLDGRSDIYSLGCVLQEMLTGEPPFRGKTVESVLDQHLRDAPPALRGVPSAAAAVIRRALVKSPSERFSSAAEFRDALAHAATRISSAAGIWRRSVVALTAVVLGSGAVATAASMSRARSPVHPAASTMVVLPLAPTAPDSILTRLGRDLVVTLSANLDGVSEIRAIDALTVLAQTRGSGSAPRDEGLRLANRLGASSAVFGTLAREGDQLRVELRVLAVPRGTTIATATMLADDGNLGALTDTLTWRLLRAVWRTRAPPTPNLGAVTTGSLPALRAFLDGERAALESRWDAAADAYARAMSEDSTFWLAHWRYAFARWWYLEAVDEEMITELHGHRFALPERDRLVFESWFTDTFSVALARSREATTRYPDYWPGWMQHADWLLHVGPVYGHDRVEARTALERTVALNPSLIPAWEHLYWVTIGEEGEAAARAVDALTRLDFPRASRAEFGFDVARVYRLELALARSRVLDRKLVDSIVVDLVTGARGRLGGGAVLPTTQVAISRRVLEARPRPQLASLHERLLADSWASRGAWDSALAIIGRHARQTPGADPLEAFRLAVIGAWLGAAPVEHSRRYRTLVGVRARRPGVSAMWHAEVAWLDGLLAAALGDREALREARERLRRADTVSTPLLDRTLGAFEAALAGERALAAATLAATNWKDPDILVPGYSEHPYVLAISRLAAARWLAAEGDTAEATRLLMWFEAEWALDGYRPARRVLAPHALLERARVASASRDVEVARRHFSAFLERYDAPAIPHRHLIDEARAALGALDTKARTGKTTGSSG